MTILTTLLIIKVESFCLFKDRHITLTNTNECMATQCVTLQENDPVVLTNPITRVTPCKLLLEANLDFFISSQDSNKIIYDDDECDDYRANDDDDESETEYSDCDGDYDGCDDYEGDYFDYDDSYDGYSSYY